MEKTLPSSQASDWREGSRLRARELKQEGWKQQDIANALGVAKGAVRLLEFLGYRTEQPGASVEGRVESCQEGAQAAETVPAPPGNH